MLEPRANRTLIFLKILPKTRKRKHFSGETSQKEIKKKITETKLID